MVLFSGLEKFCSVMNLPKPMTRCNYDKLSNLLRDAVKSVAETIMKDAAQTIRANINVNDDDIQVDTGVSVDGSWQRRGFSSLNGVVTVISIENGKILDTETICKLCKACNAKEKLRSNVGNVKNMQNTILASMFHVASSDSNNYHEYCPKTPDSWCQYQLEAINKTNMYTPGAGRSENVIFAIKPVYADLTKADILQKCLHGLTQNPNESINSKIWERAPKPVYCGLDTLELAVYDAFANYNMVEKLL